MVFHGFLTRRRQVFILAGRGSIARFLARFCQQFFHLEHQGVQVDGHNTGGTDRPELLRIVHPAGAKVPARRRRRSQIAIDLRRRTVRVIFSGGHVIKPGFRAGRIAVIPVAVQNRTIIQFYHTFIRLPRL
ncbi:hypothetical protein D3C78_1065150 [compost metagenome]